MTTFRKKLIKDNVHGYIYIEEPYFQIIDTATFQRLKNIRQTSYTSLYPSATHDRFTHSLGTFHLANLIIEKLWVNAESDLEGFSITDDDKKNFHFL